MQYDSVLEACPVKRWSICRSLHGRQDHVQRVSENRILLYSVGSRNGFTEKIMDFLETLDEKGVQIISKDVKIETKRRLDRTRGTLLREAAVSLVDSRAEDTGAEDLDRNED